jgi:hypothetical protein
MSLEEKLKTCNDELNIYKKMFHLTPDKEFNFFKLLADHKTHKNCC